MSRKQTAWAACFRLIIFCKKMISGHKMWEEGAWVLCVKQKNVSKRFAMNEMVKR